MLVLCAAPLSAQAAVHWEYGVLVMGGMRAPPAWSAATSDSTIAPSAIVDDARIMDYLKQMASGHPGQAALLFLNVAGAQGWELVTVQGDTYLFKRRRQ
jgi:hypothetical protein